MNLFISADENYVMPAKVMLSSFFLNNKFEAHNIYFMYSSIKQESLNALGDLVKENNSQFHPVLISESDFSGFKISDRFPLVVYFRFLIPHILPSEEKRALWLDVDVIVSGSIKEFYYQEFDGKALAACKDIGEQNRSHLLGNPVGTPYFNSGVLLFNVNEMRKHGLFEFYSYYLKHENEIIWPDQDIINGMFGTRIKACDHNIFNVQIRNNPIIMPQYTKKHIENQAKIIHFVGRYKPWKDFSCAAAASLWDEYYLRMFIKSPLLSVILRYYYRCKRWILRTFVYMYLVVRNAIRE